MGQAIRYEGTDSVKASDAVTIRNHGEQLDAHKQGFLTTAIHEYNGRVYRLVEQRRDGKRVMKAYRL